MLLLSGPPGSGRTFHILAELREALRRKDSGVRLLTPTATMADHLRHTLAREGFVLRPSLIQTLATFVAPWVEDLPEISPAGLHLLVERVARELAPAEFAGVLGTPGFAAALTQTIDEMASAGCDAARLSRALPRTPFGPPFVAVYERVERELAARGRALRAGRLTRAAGRIASGGLGGLRTVWIDGFFALTDPELAVIRALAAHAEVTVTLPSREGANVSREALLAMGFEERAMARRRPEPRVESFSAATLDREADEIARRIVESGDFGGTGVLVRNPEAYLAPLRAAFERFGAPARFYFSDPLSEHGVTRFLSGLVEALLSGWDHALVVEAVATGVGLPAQSRAQIDRFDFAIRERLPDRGLEALRGLTSDAALLRLLDELGSLDAWRSQTLPPALWAARLGSLRGLAHPPRPEDGAAFLETAIWRGQAAALAAWQDAMDEAARSFDPDRRIAPAVFWAAAKAVLRLSTLRAPDQRRNVVHVLSVHEARQWELPAVFLCGMAEQQFPRRQTQEPIFPDAVRARLVEAGIRVRTAAELEREERFLFDLARARATETLTLSYAEADSRYARALPSQYLERAPEPCTELVRPQPAPPAAAPEPREIRREGTMFSPSSLESFLDCPFQYFARHTLRLKTRPLAPQDRLDFMLQGTIVHQTLAEWHRQPQPIEPLFDRVFAEQCRKHAVFPGYRAESLRRRMLDDLLQFGERQKLPPAAGVLTEEEFVMPVDEALIVRGRIDRIDKLADGRALIVDYKYSGAANVSGKLEKATLLQAGLYALAVEHKLGLKPAGVFYYGLKRDSSVVGWSDPPGAFVARSQPLTREWLDGVLAKVREAVEQIRQGRIAPAPQSADLCRLCDFRDVCRYEGAARTMAAG